MVFCIDSINQSLTYLETHHFMPISLNTIMLLIDYTRLNENDDDTSLKQFFESAENKLGHVAAVCVYPRFVRLAASTFKLSPIKIATVVNFPTGNEPISTILSSIKQVIHDGANEIDLVFPYTAFLSGNIQYCEEVMRESRAACGDQITLKVILETGALSSPQIVYDASELAIAAGADFLKTSTGKIKVGADLQSAAAMLFAIKNNLSRKIGLKVSGGIRDVQTAERYIQLASHIMGKPFIHPDTFRIGASQLVVEILTL